MRKILPTLCISVIPFLHTMGQERSLKIFSNFLYASEKSSRENTSSSERDFNIFPGISFAFHGKKGHFQEAGLVRLSFDRSEFETIDNGITIRGAVTRNFEARVRYDYNFKLAGPAEGKWKLYVGPSISPYYRRETNEPKISTSFHRISWSLGSYLSLLARSTIALSPKVLLDINIPLNIASLEYRRYRVDNPNIPLSQQHADDFDAEAVPTYLEFRMGIGIKL